MTYRPVRRAILLPTVIAVALSPFFSALIATTLASTPAAAATVTTHTPVMGPNLLSANQLARWYNSESRLMRNCGRCRRHCILRSKRRL